MLVNLKIFHNRVGTVFSVRSILYYFEKQSIRLIRCGKNSVNLIYLKTGHRFYGTFIHNAHTASIIAKIFYMGTRVK
jgi:hypothetical protein